ncbi:hypothetical protein ABZ926_09180 [Streptomyces litmocidini]|uniref:hypothetical protein n=1 Tax=Streptomyces litmocidini TaxID=67318 RepID=UPI0033D45B5E
MRTLLPATVRSAILQPASWTAPGDQAPGQQPVADDLGSAAVRPLTARTAHSERPDGRLERAVTAVRETAAE